VNDRAINSAARVLPSHGRSQRFKSSIAQVFYRQGPPIVRMDKVLFNPNRIELPLNLLLIPQFWDNDYYERLKKESIGNFKLLTADVLLFENYTVIVGFLGYPNILTLLEFISDVKNKDIYFLGTAGSLNETILGPLPLQVETIHSTALLDHYSPLKFFSMKPFQLGNFRKAAGVTVDIIQRETDTWLREQVQREMDFVEMEIFPLRAYIGKPFTAIVITSDLLKENGIEVFQDKKRLREEFVGAYELIVNSLPSKD
jgi:hypothetical protein